MNKKQIREAVQDAIASSDEVDVKLVADGLEGVMRRWGRFDVFLVSLEMNLRSIDQELSDELRSFRERVQKDINPLLDASADIQEKSQ